LNTDFKHSRFAVAWDVYEIGENFPPPLKLAELFPKLHGHNYIHMLTHYFFDNDVLRIRYYRVSRASAHSLVSTQVLVGYMNGERPLPGKSPGKISTPTSNPLYVAQSCIDILFNTNT
jgi:hypothetical protein